MKLKDKITISQNNDIELWNAMKAGHKIALEQIYNSNIQLLLNYSNKFIHDKNLIADTIQDLFIDIWERRDNLASTNNISKYLLKSLRYKLIRKQASSKKVLSINNITDSYHFDLCISVEDSLISEDNYNEQIRQLNNAFKSLSPRQQEAIFLKYYSSMSYVQISELMEISEQAVYNLISKGLKILHLELNQTIGLALLLLFLIQIF